MKKYEETANAVFDKSRKIKYRRKKAAGATAISAVTMCLALTLCIGAGYTITNRADAPTTPAAVDTTAAVPVVSSPPASETAETANVNVADAENMIPLDQNQSSVVFAVSPDPDNPALLWRCGPEIDSSIVLWESGSTPGKANAVKLQYRVWHGKLTEKNTIEYYETRYNLYSEYLMPMAVFVSGVGFDEGGLDEGLIPIYQNTTEQRKEAFSEYEYTLRKLEDAVFEKLAMYLNEKGITSERIAFAEDYGYANSGFLLMYVTIDQFAELDLTAVGMDSEWHGLFKTINGYMRMGYVLPRKANA